MSETFLSAFTGGLIALALAVSITFILNSILSYKLAKVQKQILKYDQEATEVNRELNRSINALRSEFGFKVESLHKPIVPHILRMRWLDYQRDKIETVPFVQWTANELAKRLEIESGKGFDSAQPDTGKEAPNV